MHLAVIALVAVTARAAPDQAARADAPTGALAVDWRRPIATSVSTPTLQVVVNPQLLRGARLHDPAFSALKALGAEHVRYVPWLPYPRQAVAELDPPKDGRTFWDFAHIDPTLEDFMAATAGHSVVLNFSTIPAWMFKTEQPVTFPDDPNQVFWNYVQGTELVDPSMRQAAGYFGRLVSWYTRGGFRDELGRWHASGHRYKVPVWEVLNEIDIEHNWSPQNYTRFYDAVVAELRKIDPAMRFVGLSLARPAAHQDMFEYFLDPKNHAPGTPLDYISYHFYAVPDEGTGIDKWQHSFFAQADAFLDQVRRIEEVRKRLSPKTRTMLNELGVILLEDSKEINVPGYVAKDEPAGYWTLAAALYADLYLELAKLGIDVVGESQLVGYKSQFPSVSMISEDSGRPNARYWVLKLIKDHFGPGDVLVDTAVSGDSRVAAQAFKTASGQAILVVNKDLAGRSLTLPAECDGALVTFVAPSTGEGKPGHRKVDGRVLDLEPNEVAVITPR